MVACHSVSGLSALGEINGGVRYLFYAILCMGRKSSYGLIPLNSVAKSVGCIALSPIASLYVQEFYYFHECFELLLHCFYTLCADGLMSFQSSSLLSGQYAVIPLPVLSMFLLLPFTLTLNQSLLVHSTKEYLLNCISYSLPTLAQQLLLFRLFLTKEEQNCYPIQPGSMKWKYNHTKRTHWQICHKFQAKADCHRNKLSSCRDRVERVEFQIEQTQNILKCTGFANTSGNLWL